MSLKALSRALQSSCTRSVTPRRHLLTLSTFNLIMRLLFRLQFFFRTDGKENLWAIYKRRSQIGCMSHLKSEEISFGCCNAIFLAPRLISHPFKLNVNVSYCAGRGIELVETFVINYGTLSSRIAAHNRKRLFFCRERASVASERALR